jgi:AcrR family transcriptional regulator
MRADWLVGDHSALAAERILDAAGRCFVEKGVARTSVGDVAQEAGCSRPTVYRYFEDRDALRRAFVHREARRIGAEVLDEVARIKNPQRRLVSAVLAALRRVRADPTLAAWFSSGESSAATDVAGTSPVLESLVAAFLGDASNDRTRESARWVVRVVLSLLTMPGADEAEERALLERFVLPVVA